MIDERVGPYAIQVLETLTGVEIKVSKGSKVQYVYADFYDETKEEEE